MSCGEVSSVCGCRLNEQWLNYTQGGRTVTAAMKLSQAALRHSVRAGAAHRPGAKPARSSIPWAARWPSGGQPQDHPSLQISRLRPPDLGVPAFQKPVPAPDSAWAQSPPPSTRSRTPPGPQPHLPDGRGGKHLPFGAHAEDHHGGHHHDEVWGDRATVTSQAAGHQQRGWQSAGQGPTRGRPSPHPRHVSRPPEPPCPALAHRLLRAVDTRLVLSVTRPPPCPVSSI